MSKFKVGDKVKVRKEYRIRPEHVCGVVEMDSGYGMYRVRMTPDYEGSPNDSRIWTYYELELKRREPERSLDPVREYPTLDEVMARVQSQDVQLTLTRSEAETLALILSYVAGTGTGRERMASLSCKLYDVGVRWTRDVKVRHYREPKEPTSCPGLRLADVS